MAFKRSSNSAGGLQATFDSGTPAQKAAFRASVSGAPVVADFAELLAVASPTAGAQRRVAAPVVPGGVPYTDWVYDGTRWLLDGPQDLFVGLTPTVGVAGTSEQILRQWRLPAGLLESLRYLSCWWLSAKSGTTDAVTLRARLGVAGSSADASIAGANTGMSAGVRTYAYDLCGFAASPTTWRAMSTVPWGGMISGASGTIAYPFDVTIPAVNSGLYLSLCMAMSGGTDVPSIPHAVIRGG